MDAPAIVLPTPDTAADPLLAPAPAPMQARNEHLFALWLHGRSAGTRRAYAADLAAFFAHVRCPLQAVTLGGVQDFRDTLGDLATATQARRLSAVKSLLSFAHRTGFLAVNVGAAIRLPPVKATLAEHILDVDAVLHMLALERHPRNKALLRLLYLGGLRISEVCGLRTRDMHAHVSHALDRGAPVHLVQATVGHASLTTTSRYAHAQSNNSSSRHLPG